MKIKLIHNKNFDQIFDKIINFYQPRYEEDYKKVLKNSQLVCFCEENNEIIGVVRVVSDMVKNATIYDLVVRKSDRNKGIGTKLINCAIKELKKMDISKICLTTDSRSPWLVKYYEKLGFKKPQKEHYMLYTHI
jgi:ribosomal protein S18 acetylase RimI-like enzyme